MGMKIQYPAMSRMGASVSPPRARSAYPKKIAANATHHHIPPRHHGRGAASPARGVDPVSRFGTVSRSGTQ
jgi:hypothetical protein